MTPCPVCRHLAAAHAPAAGCTACGCTMDPDVIKRVHGERQALTEQVREASGELKVQVAVVEQDGVCDNCGTVWPRAPGAAGWQSCPNCGTAVLFT